MTNLKKEDKKLNNNNNIKEGTEEFLDKDKDKDKQQIENITSTISREKQRNSWGKYRSHKQISTRGY